MNKEKLLLGLFLIGAFLMASIRISRAGINNIKSYEALRLNAYQDTGGVWTIGYGHVILPNEKYLLTGAITENKAEELLKKDLEQAENIVNHYVKVPLTGNQYDALVSFVFNVGSGNFIESTLLEKLNAKDYDGAAAEFPKWIYDNEKQIAGLIARRAKEQNTFLS